MLTSVTPERRRISQYSPYPPNVESTTSHTTAVQKEPSAGGVRPPVAAARAVNTRALVTAWTVIDTIGRTSVRERRSRNVAATRLSMPRKGTRYAHHATPVAAPASAAVTTATPATPRPSPSHWARDTATPSSGPASAPATRGCVPSMRAVVPLETPSSIA